MPESEPNPNSEYKIIQGAHEAYPSYFDVGTNMFYYLDLNITLTTKKP